MFFSSKSSRNFRKFSWISLSACRPQTRLYNVHFAYHYQTAELEQSRWTSDVIVVTRPVSMGTWASLPPEVFVVVDGVKSPISVLFRAMSGALEIRFCVSQRLDKVNLIVHAHKPPVVETDERLNSLTDMERPCRWRSNSAPKPSSVSLRWLLDPISLVPPAVLLSCSPPPPSESYFQVTPNIKWSLSLLNLTKQLGKTIARERWRTFSMTHLIPEQSPTLAEESSTPTTCPW